MDKIPGDYHDQLALGKGHAKDSRADLVDLLSAGSHSPSRSAMGHEAVHAVQKAIAGLPEDYGQAIQLRLLEGKSLEETAATMNLVITQVLCCPVS